MTLGLSRTPSGRVQAVLDIAATLAFIATCGTVVWTLVINPTRGATNATARGTRPPEPPPPSDPVSLEGALLQGNPVAKAVLIEYSDFQCPFCARFARDIMPKLDEKYIKSGKVQLAFRHLPLPMHPFAQKAAEAVECAARQGAFWGMHNRVFQQPEQLEEASLRQNARALMLNEEQFSTCLAGQAGEKVRRDAAGARKLLVTGTPTFFVGTRQADGRVKVVQRVSGAPALEQFEAVLERVLAAK